MKATVFIDGGFLRTLTRKAGYRYDPNYIEAVDRVILISGDTDCLPAVKFARTAGLQIVLIELPGERLARELHWHCDLVRPIAWPDQ